MSKGRNSKVPKDDAELALLWELYKAGGELDTCDLVERAMSHFPILERQEERDCTTPSGRPWWPGRFRLNLADLKKRGEVVNIKHGRWGITEKGRNRLKEAGYRVEEQQIGLKKEACAKKSPNRVTSELILLWMRSSEGAFYERYEQLCDRVSGLLSLEALPDTQSLFKKLELVLDLNHLLEVILSVVMPEEITTDEWKIPHLQLKGENATDRLWQIWCDNSELTKARATKQISERIFGLLSLVALPETREIYDQLVETIDFVDMCDRVGALSISGFSGGSQSLLEPFD